MIGTTAAFIVAPCSHEPRGHLLRRFRRSLLAAPVVGMALSAGTAHAQSAGDTTSPGTTEIPEINVTASRPGLIGQQPDAEGITDYRVTRNTTGAKSDIPDRDIPQAVVVVPQRVIEEQNSQTLNEVLRNVSGAQATQSAVQGAQYPILRGFVSRNFYKDGMRDDTFDRTYWLGNIERVEVLKGPASVLYGDGSLGGIINLVSKKPLPYNTISTSVWGGNYQSLGASTDMSAKLNDQGTALIRIIGDVSHKDTFVDNFESDAYHFSALFQGEVNDCTSVTIGAEHRDRKIGNDSGIPAFAIDYGLPRSRNYNAPWSTREDTADNLSAKLVHAFNDDWKITSGLLLTRYEFDQTLTTSISASPVAMTVTRRGEYANSVTNEVLSDTHLDGRVVIGGFVNKITVGVEYSTGTVTVDRFRKTATSAVNLFNPNVAFTLFPLSQVSDLTFGTDRKGIYAQDLIELTPRLKLMVGTRYDDMSRSARDPIVPASTATNGTSEDNEWSQRIGATFELTRGVTLYGSYSHSFVPPGTTVSLGNVVGLLPETGEQYESGLKLDIGDAFTATAAVYQLTRQNVATTDIVTGITTAVGEQRSTGFEFDATYKIMRGWNLLANYAYTDAEITKDLKFTVGNKISNVAPHTARLWSVYEVQDGPWAGFGFGGGLTYVGERPVNLLNNYYMAGYTTVDLTAYYKIKNLKFSVNANNIFDKRYYVASNAADTDNATFLYFGEPSTVIAKLELTF